MCGPHVIHKARKTFMTASGHAPETPGGTITAERPAPPARPAGAGLGRRRMLTGSAAVGAVLTGIGALGGPVESAHAQTIAGISPSRLTVTDLTHVLHNDFPIYRPYILDPNIFQFASIEEDGFNALKLEIDEHTGTHFDAPWHFNDSADALHTHEVDPRDLVCPLVVVRIADRAARHYDAQVTVADLRRWERRHGRIPRGALVAMDSGWSARVLQSEEAMLNRDSDGVAHFPGFDIEAIDWLLSARDIAGIAVDTPSFDYGPDSASNPEAHVFLLGENKYAVEMVAHLERAPESGAMAIVGVANIRGGSGGPVRLLALS
ncbi:MULTISPECIES: cyclase family protein [Nocardiopsis]|uniref:cyclase family protein n=1 Tax=Nocardiopsis TaxID=2013 RepID=UPI0008FC5B00|nr:MULTISPECIES: cyclase family protein [Nocardiopsis]APC36835.1 cyclase [Nocardiopsis dassonvillei]